MYLYNVVFKYLEPREGVASVSADSPEEAVRKFRSQLDEKNIDGFEISGVVNIGEVQPVALPEEQEEVKQNVTPLPKRPVAVAPRQDFSGNRLPPPTITRNVEEIKVIVGDPDKEQK